MVKRYIFVIVCLFTFVFSKEKLDINIKNLDLITFSKLVSKILDKNILIATDLKGKVGFISNKPIYKEDLLKIFSEVLYANGYDIVYNKNFLKIIKYTKKKIVQQNSLDIVYLQNTEASSIIKVLQNILKNSKYKLTISLDTESNAIVLMGEKNFIDIFKTLIKKLDINKQQVYVKAKIIEISQIKSKEIGLKYGLLAGQSNSSGLLTLAANLGGAAVSIDTSSIGLSIPTLSKGIALGATLNLLNQNGAADIVSEPSLLCINNKQSSIYVGETRSIKVGTTTTSGGNIQDIYKREDIGLTLTIKPRISSNNTVILDIATKLENIGHSTTNGQPNTLKKDLKTTAIVKDGESIILGGYRKIKKEYTSFKVPILGDIPILGYLFRDKQRVNDKIDLVIIITPYIVPKDKNLTYIRDQLATLNKLEDLYKQKALEKLKPKLSLKSKKISSYNSENILDQLYGKTSDY